MKAKAKLKLAQQQAERQLARLDVTPVTDPLTTLAELAGQALAFRDEVARMVNELGSIRYSTDGGEQLRAEVALWERALDRCERFVVSMARLNIDERLARISERQADIVIAAIEAALATAGVAGEQADTARAVAAKHLTVVRSPA